LTDRVSESRRVYLDCNATVPLLPVSAQAMAAEAVESWGNPSSVHAEGRRARRSLEASRATIARGLGVSANEIVFTSGGTESNNLALRSACRSGAELLTSRLEHPSVVRLAERLEGEGVRVRWVAVRAGGRIDLDDLERALREAPQGKAVVALQAVNHETGVIQPVREAAELCERWGARLHVDAVQAVGKIADDAWRLADTVAVAAHKLGGPKGIGAALARGCTTLEPLLWGGSQEGGVRPGTPSVALAAGFAAAVDWAIAGPSRYDSVRALRDQLEQALVDLGGELNGADLRAPHVVNVSFQGLAADELVAALDMEGIAVSSGSACSSGTVARSPVVEAMVGAVRAGGAVRASLGELTTAQDVNAAILAWRRVVTRGRGHG